MQTIIHFDSLTILFLALLFITPDVNAASLSKGAALSTATVADVEGKADDPKAIPPKPSAQSNKKGKAPKLKSKRVAPPQRAIVGRPMKDLNAKSLGKDIPIPNDSEIGISLPGSAESSLTVGSPGDKHEQEADTVAERVTGNPKPKMARGLSPGDVVGKNPDVDPGGPVSGWLAPGSTVGLDPRDNPGGPVSIPGVDVGLDPRDDPSGPVSVGQ